MYLASKGRSAAVSLVLAVCTVCASGTVQSKDPGVDVGIIITDSANLREEPYRTAAIVRKIARDDFVVLLSREHLNGWYNVIHVDSGDEGWLHGNSIKVSYTTNPRRESPFSAERTDSYSDPTVYVSNESNKTLSLTIGSSKYTIGPGTNRSITIRPGSYRYVASAPGVIPAMGTHEWSVGYTYTWRFWIETTYR